MSTDNKTLVILSPGFPKDEADSTCLPFIQSFVKTLKKNNKELNIFVLAFQYPFTDTAYQWHEVNVVPFNGRNKGRLNRILTWLKVRRYLKNILKTEHVIGMLNLWLGETAFIGHSMAKKSGIRSFTWLMGQDAKENNRYVSLVRPALGKLIAVSDFLAEEFYRNYKILPAHIIQPGIDIKNFADDDMFRHIDIIGAGSLIKLKQFEIFIDIVKELSKIFPGIKAVICGEGPERKRLFEQIGEAGLHANIVLLGETPHLEVLRLMQQSKILLHTSAYEGFGVVYAEALYAGAKVICFRSPMNKAFQNQYAAADAAAMIKIAGDFLASENTIYESVLTEPIESTCKKIMSLYD